MMSVFSLHLSLLLSPSSSRMALPFLSTRKIHLIPSSPVQINLSLLSPSLAPSPIKLSAVPANQWLSHLSHKAMFIPKAQPWSYWVRVMSKYLPPTQKVPGKQDRLSIWYPECLAIVFTEDQVWSINCTEFSGLQEDCGPLEMLEFLLFQYGSHI